MFYGPAYVVTGILYFVLCYPLSVVARKMELRKKKLPKLELEANQKADLAGLEGGV